MIPSFVDNVRCVLPEVFLIAAACLQFLVGPFLVTDGSTTSRGVSRLWSGLSLLAIVAAAAVWQIAPSADMAANSLGMFQSDVFVWFVRGVTLSAGLVLVLINWDEVTDAYAAEFHGLLLLILAGIGLTAAANDLVVLFLSLEIVSIPTYVFLYLPRRAGPSPEAMTKYFLLSIFSSAMVLYGFSFLYGAVGTTQLGAIHLALGQHAATKMPSILLIATACIVAGLSFRVTAVPFHFYAPDVIQGSHAGAGAMLSFLPKVVGFVALLRIIDVGGLDDLAGSSAERLRLWCSTVFWLMAVASMFLGNVMALLQTNVKRMLAYSSISHAGYMLVGLAIPSRASAVDGVAALLFYLVAYGATISGVFGLLVYLRRGSRSIETVDDLAGLARSHPVPSALLTILLFSLTGLPPTAGFLGKLGLLLAAWSQGTTSARVLALVMAVNAAIAAGYYLRLVGAMYLRPAAGPVETSGRLPTVVGIAACVFFTVGLFFFPSLLWDIVDHLIA